MIQIIDCLQGTAEWLKARAGIPTASEFHTVMAKGEGKTRRTYMLKLAGEIITGEPSENFVSKDMERGKVMEDEARERYAFIRDAEPLQVGFIRNGGTGASPDSLLGTEGGLEIKTALPHIQIERLFRNDLPPEHKAQVQGTLWVAERGWWDFMSYWPKMPPLIVRIPRDEPYIANLASEVDRFNDELAEVVERVRRYGRVEAAAA